MCIPSTSRFRQKASRLNVALALVCRCSLMMFVNRDKHEPELPRIESCDAQVTETGEDHWRNCQDAWAFEYFDGESELYLDRERNT